MKKLTIITGLQGTGKRKKAKELAAKFSENEVAFLSARGHSFLKTSHVFDQCQLDTKLIVVTDISDLQDLFCYLFLASYGLMVNRKGENPFMIYPEITLICIGISFADKQNIDKARFLVQDNQLIEIIECEKLI